MSIIKVVEPPPYRLPTNEFWEKQIKTIIPSSYENICRYVNTNINEWTIRIQQIQIYSKSVAEYVVYKNGIERIGGITSTNDRNMVFFFLNPILLEHGNEIIIKAYHEYSKGSTEFKTYLLGFYQNN